jgi:thermitase
VISVDPALVAPGVRSWLTFLREREGAVEGLHPDLNALLRRYRTPVQVTREYPRRSPEWTRDELQSGLDSVYRMILREQRRIPPALVEDIRLLPFVRSVRVGNIARADLPELQLSISQSMARDYESIGLSEAHEFTRGDSSVRVAVLDTGVDVKHPELVRAADPGMDFVDMGPGMDPEALRDFVGDRSEVDADPDDEVGHGTHVAGIVAGEGLRMIRGVAPDCRIVPVRALAALRNGRQRVGAGLEDNINTAIKWAVDQGVHVVNASLGIRHEGGGLPHREVVEYARRKGVTIIAASGNDGRRELYYPGALPYVIAVGAADASGGVAPFSTYGDQVSLIAPGTKILSSYPRGAYAHASGTSQAAPFVAGAVALLKSFAIQLGKRLGDRQVKYLLKSTADRGSGAFKHPKAGFGHLNVADAMRLLAYRFDRT